MTEEINTIKDQKKKFNKTLSKLKIIIDEMNKKISMLKVEEHELSLQLNQNTERDIAQPCAEKISDKAVEKALLQNKIAPAPNNLEYSGSLTLTFEENLSMKFFMGFEFEASDIKDTVEATPNPLSIYEKEYIKHVAPFFDTQPEEATTSTDCELP